MKTIVINSRKHGKCEILIDDSDAQLVRGLQLSIQPNTYGKLYVRTIKNGKSTYLHRVITKCSDNMVVDHINRDTFDNRRENLRITTQQENLKNRSTFKNNKLGEKLISKSYLMRRLPDGRIKKYDSYNICYITSDGIKKNAWRKSLSSAILLRDQILKEHYSFTSNVSTQDTPS